MSWSGCSALHGVNPNFFFKKNPLLLVGDLNINFLDYLINTNIKQDIKEDGIKYCKSI